MGKPLGGHVAGGHSLHPVVADGGGGAQPFLDIAGFELDASRGRAPRREAACPHTPARQSACSSIRTDSALA